MGILKWTVLITFLSAQVHALQCKEILFAKSETDGVMSSLIESLSPDNAGIYRSELEDLLSMTYKDVLGEDLLNEFYFAQTSSDRANALMNIQKAFEKKIKHVLSLLELLNRNIKRTKVEKAYRKEHGHPYPRIDKEIDRLFDGGGKDAVENLLSKRDLRMLKDDLIFDIGGTRILKGIERFYEKHGRLPKWAPLLVNTSYYTKKYLRKRNLVLGLVLVLSFPLLKATIDLKNTTLGAANVASRQLSADQVASMTAGLGIGVYDQKQLDTYYDEIVDRFGFTGTKEAFMQDFGKYIHDASLAFKRQETRTASDVQKALGYINALKGEQLDLSMDMSLTIEQIREDAKTMREALARLDKEAKGQDIQELASPMEHSRALVFDNYDRIRDQAALLYFSNTGGLGISDANFIGEQDGPILNLDEKVFSKNAVTALGLWKDYYLFYGGDVEDFKRLGID